VQVPDRARGDPLEAAREIPAARYPGADSLLLAVRSRAARPPSPPISISLCAIADEVLAPDAGGCSTVIGQSPIQPGGVNLLRAEANDWRANLRGPYTFVHRGVHRYGVMIGTSLHICTGGS